MARNGIFLEGNVLLLHAPLFLLLLLIPQPLISGYRHDYHDALHKCILFFEGQHFGRFPPDQPFHWRCDSALHDGVSANVDLTGGYYNAGDNIKFPMACKLFQAFITT